MSSGTDFGEWQPLAAAPRDGTRVLVLIRASEQGSAEVDVARWVKTGLSEAEGWMATDSDRDCVVAYAEAELAGWMPLPAALPKLRSEIASGAAKSGEEEMAGSGI